MTFDDSGMAIDRRSRTQTVSVSRDEYRVALERGIIFGINLPIKTPGAFQLRIAVRDANSGRVGSANQYIEVPNLKKGRLTVSGIFLAQHEEATQDASSRAGLVDEKTSSRSEAEVAESDPQGGPAIRRFALGAMVDYGFEIYNARIDKTIHQPHLQSQVHLFRDNKLVFTGRVLDLSGLADSKRLAAFGRLPLPANLLAGDYVLQIIVTDALAKDKDRIATQWIDFEIK